MQTETGIAVTADNLEVARSAETILIGVKPTVVLAVVREIAPVTEDKTVISLAAGVRVRNMESISSARLMRAMTNTPTAIGRGATVLEKHFTLNKGLSGPDHVCSATPDELSTLCRYARLMEKLR